MVSAYIFPNFLSNNCHNRSRRSFYPTTNSNFVEDYNEYYKCPRLASILSKYVRNFLYMYDELYASYEKVCTIHAA